MLTGQCDRQVLLYAQLSSELLTPPGVTVHVTGGVCEREPSFHGFLGSICSSLTEASPF